jgi:hypothetical protein
MHPNFEGTWNWESITPLQRPAGLSDKEVLTPEERAKLEADTSARRANRDESKPPPAGSVGSYNAFWSDGGTKTVATGRSSLITDPPDGRVPAMTPSARIRYEERARAAERFDDPDAAWPWDRCLVGFNAGPPINYGEYNANLQIVQTDEYIVLATEMVHDARIIPLKSRPLTPPTVRPWNGISTGRWEGNTLVIETTKFRPEGTGVLHLHELGVGVTDENLHLVERLSRMSDDVLLYEYTIDDPTVWTRPWTVSMTFQRSDSNIYEYACHEGNYSMQHSLAGARAAEKRQSEAPPR